MTKNKSFRTKTFKVLNISAAEQPKIDIPIKSTNCQDDEDDFGPRAESDDSDDDYDGVPRTEDIPVIHPIKPLDSDKIDNSMDKNEISIDQEILDLPQTSIVEDHTLKINLRGDGQVKSSVQHSKTKMS